MSIVIDANTLSLVFCPTPNDDFGPIKEWVVQGAGRIVVGGTKYKEELRRVSQALRFVNELNKIGKVLIVSDHDVDRLEEGIKKIVSPKCDDPHLIALIGVPDAHLYVQGTNGPTSSSLIAISIPGKHFAQKYTRANVTLINC